VQRGPFFATARRQVLRGRAAAGGGPIAAAARDCKNSLNHLKELMSPDKSGRRLPALVLALAVIAVPGGSAAEAQNLDRGKPAAKLFADNCASCHRSPRGLGKGRFSLTLYLFLQKHYASNSRSAWALSSYLASVDSGKGAPSRAAARRARTDVKAGASRPPMPVPAR
jgi:mono/diheme cytochrome c family protein